MANTQTTVPKFTTLEVLSSADQNITAGTGCPVFANATTRNAAFGGANKVLAEGQICYLESTNVVQLYDGAAWQTVGPAPAVSSGLVLISTGSASAGATLAFTNVFNSTYDTYKIIFRKYAVSLNNSEMYFQLGTSGTAYAGADYFYNGLTAQAVVTGTDTVTSATAWVWASNAGAANNWAEFIISNPNNVDYTMMFSNTLGNYSARFYNNLRWHQLRTTTQYTDFFITSSNTPGICEYAIYGFAK